MVRRIAAINAILIATLLLVATACGPGATPAPRAVTPTPAPKPVVKEWSPTRPIEFVIMAGTGGGADIYARFITALVEKNKLSPQPLLPVNRPGGAGAVAMDYVLKQKGDPHVIVITLNSFISTPIEQKLPFNWRSFTPVANLAWDGFFLWVHQDSPWKSAEAVVQAGREKSLAAAGTGTKQEDEILFALLAKQSGMKPVKYVPYPGGGDVARSLAGKTVEVTVNNPSEGIPFYPDKLRPLAVFLSKRVGPPFDNVPTMKEAGFALDPEDYVLMRAIFMSPDVPKEAQEWMVKFFQRVFDHPEFQEFLKKQALEPKFMTGDEFTKWLDGFDKFHAALMQDLGWVK